MRTTVIIKHLACNDCRPVILEAFYNFKGISNVVANVTLGSLTFDYTWHNALEGLRMHLAKIGHAITGDANVIEYSEACITELDRK